MLVGLEKKTGDTFQGSLERSQFDRLLHALTVMQKEIENDLTKNPEEYMRIWEDVFRYFKRYGQVRLITSLTLIVSKQSKGCKQKHFRIQKPIHCLFKRFYCLVAKDIPAN